LLLQHDAGKPNVTKSRSQFWPTLAAAQALNIMALLEILEFPDPRLRTRAAPVDTVTEITRKLIEDMFETMYNAPGIGLAATQVNVHQRILVMDVSEENDRPLVFINPDITARSETLEDYDEGCLSVPGFFEPVTRPQEVTVTALDRNGDAFNQTLSGLEAVCLQHEIDHLNGKLFVDYLSPLKRQRIRKKLEKDQRCRA
jgi:peptide deformylase